MSSLWGPARRGPMLVLYALAILALLFGLYARFKGLYAASMAPDEYYIARSVQNILRFGIPEFDCGGYYPRALTFQYVVALFALAGVDPSGAARGVAAVCSIATLPAGYILARRAGGKAMALAMVAILAISVWEVEVARFGRMYAPFQAVFLWYVVFVLKVAVDRKREALWPLFFVSVLGAVTWEGGAFLALANVVLLFAGNRQGRLDWRGALFAFANLALFLGAYTLLAANLRLAGNEPQFPPDFDLDAAREAAAAALGRTPPIWEALGAHPAWAVVGLIPAALALNASRWIWSLRRRWPLALGLMLGLGMALIHQFAALATVLLLLALMGCISLEDLRGRGPATYFAAILGCLAFWLAFGVLTGWTSTLEMPWLGHSRVIEVLYEFVRFPDVLRQIAQPWFAAEPVLAVAGAILIPIALWQVLREDYEGNPRRIIALVLVFMAMAVGSTSPPREETRYVFFLFPIALLVMMVPIANLTQSVLGWRAIQIPGAGALVAFALYLLTEDFQPMHLLRIDTPAALMRMDISAHLETHVVPRTDVRGAAEWLATASRDHPWLRVNAYPTADYYFADFDFAYLDRDGRRFRAYSCSRGTKERWGGLPLIHSIATLREKIALSGGAYIVTSSQEAERFSTDLSAWRPRVAWRSLDGEIAVLALGAAAG